MTTPVVNMAYNPSIDEEVNELVGKARWFIQLQRAAQNYREARQPVPREIRDHLNALEAEYAVLSPGDREFIDKRLAKEYYAQTHADLAESETAARAAQLRNREEVAREFTKGMFGEKNGLSLENYQRTVEDPKAKTVKLATGRAKIGEENLQDWANGVAPKLGAKKGAGWRQVQNILDRYDELRTTDPERYKKAAIEHGVETEFLDKLLDGWSDYSFRLSWAEHLSKQDDEAGLKDEQEVPISDSERLRADLINAVVNHSAAEAEENPEMADDLAGEISQRYREDAVHETIALRNKPGARGDELSMQDALTRAFDAVEERSHG